MLTIVMYHYVRCLEHSPAPRIKALETADFEGQLDYIERHYTVCPLADVVAAVRGGSPLPDDACVLTFDDGLIDHYDTVWPILQRRGLRGAFFPPAAPIIQRTVLDVHKIHFILALSDDLPGLADHVLELAARWGGSEVPSAADLRSRHAQPSRFDPPDVAMIKRVLQHALPHPLRQRIVAHLFAQIVAADEPAFADTLYMSLDHIRTLHHAGMDIGGHGDRHIWMGRAPAAEQAVEMARTVEFLTRVTGTAPKAWAFCYPYGSYDNATMVLARQSGCAVGLTTAVETIEHLNRPLELPRLDTHDLPKTAGVAAT